MPNDVQIHPVSSWQKPDCLFCARRARREVRHGVAAIRCCGNPVCVEKAAHLACGYRSQPDNDAIDLATATMRFLEAESALRALKDARLAGCVEVQADVERFGGKPNSQRLCGRADCPACDAYAAAAAERRSLSRARLRALGQMLAIHWRMA